MLFVRWIRRRRLRLLRFCIIVLFTHMSPPDIYILSLHDALPISAPRRIGSSAGQRRRASQSHDDGYRSEEHTSELQSRQYLVCRLLLEKKKSYKKFHIALREWYRFNASNIVVASLHFDCFTLI